MSLPKILIVGPSRCGKDLAGEWFSMNTPCVYGGTTSKYLCPYVAERLGITEKFAYDTRHQRRKTWYEVGRELREQNPGFLINLALANGNVIAGVRDKEEIEYACREGIVNHIVWIDRPWLKDITLMFTQADCFRLCEEHGWKTNFSVIDNSGSVAQLYLRLGRYCQNLNIPIKRS